MRTAADTFEETHPIVAGMVEMAQRRVGSRMTAYQEVGRTIGQSGSWVRKLIGRQPVAIEKHVFENIMAAYRSLCERVEADRDLERARFLALGKVTHETDQGVDHEVGVAQRRRPAGPRPAASVVARPADGSAQ